MPCLKEEASSIHTCFSIEMDVSYFPTTTVSETQILKIPID